MYVEIVGPENGNCLNYEFACSRLLALSMELLDHRYTYIESGGYVHELPQVRGDGGSNYCAWRYN